MSLKNSSADTAVNGATCKRSAGVAAETAFGVGTMTSKIRDFLIFLVILVVLSGTVWIGAEYVKQGILSYFRSSRGPIHRTPHRNLKDKNPWKWKPWLRISDD